jgi:hypothetical protein
MPDATTWKRRLRRLGRRPDVNGKFHGTRVGSVADGEEGSGVGKELLA